MHVRTTGAATDQPALAAILRAGLLLSVVDGAFSSFLSAFVYGSTVARLFQGVAFTLLGQPALDGGTRTALIGVAMHVGVAFTWSAAFVLVVMRWPLVRRALESRAGAFTVAAVYGPCIWLVMSLIVIPVLAHRPISFNIRWMIQLAGHVFFVGLPIVIGATRRWRRQETLAPASA